MCALTEDGVGKTDTIIEWPASAPVLRDEAKAAQLDIEQTKVKGFCGCR